MEQKYGQCQKNVCRKRGEGSNKQIAEEGIKWAVETGPHGSVKDCRCLFEDYGKVG